MQRYQKCLTCEKRGEGCDGPNLLTLTSSELIEFCKAVRLIRGLSIADVAEGSGIPRGTIGRIFSAEEGSGFHYDTIRAIALFLCGCKFLGNPCPTPDGWEMERANDRLEQRQQRVEHLEGELARTKDLYDGLRSYHRDYVRFMRRTVITLGIAAGLLTVTLITLLIIDATVPDLGFFFRR